MKTGFFPITQRRGKERKTIDLSIKTVITTTCCYSRAVITGSFYYLCLLTVVTGEKKDRSVGMDFPTGVCSPAC